LEENEDMEMGDYRNEEEDYIQKEENDCLYDLPKNPALFLEDFNLDQIQKEITESLRIELHQRNPST